MKYRADIDGLRALGILLVLAFHAFPTYFGNGFVGVDIFFVISGFLITSAIFNNLMNGTFSLLNFYIRRIKRIFPTALLVLVVCMAIAALTMFQTEFLRFKEEFSAAAGFYMNFFFPANSGYFSVESKFRPLIHFWSLAVEEQFYLVWPLFLWIVFNESSNFSDSKDAERKKTFAVTTAIALAVVASLSAFTLNDYYYFSPFCRIWEFALGGLGAIIVKSKFADLINRRTNFILAFGLATMAVIFFAHNERIVIFCSVIASLLFLITPGNAVAKKIITFRFIRYIGIISYPLYLWHWPLLSFARIYNPNISATTVLILILLSFILAALTHAGIEKRFQNKNYDISPLSTKHNRKSIAIISVLLLSMLTLYAGAERLQKPADKEVNKLYVIDESILNLVPSCLIAADFVTENKVAWCKRDPVPRAVEGVVIGDSHAHAAFIGMATDESKIAWQLVANHSCPPYPSGLDSPCNKMIEKTYEKIKEAKDLKFVVLIMANRVFQENRQTLNRENIVAEIKKLTQSGKTIVIVRPVPEIAEHIDSCLFQRFPFYEKYDTSDQCSISTTDWKQTSLDYNTFINYIKSQLPTVLVVDPAREICDAKTCNSIKNNISLYNDKDHLSYLGSRLVARNINWAINFYLGK